jgi:DNA-binding transcriptional MerR regulator/methylmalonyl-CoA mutase cobalamin-binding subunit
MWDPAGVYTIGHAARLTGVPSATIRAWERRYGLVHPIRTEGGYRLYDEQGLQLLRAMGALVAAGWSPSQAAEHLRSDVADSSAPGDLPDTPWDAHAGPDAAGPAARSGAATSTSAGSADAPGESDDSSAWDVTALARGAAELDPAAVEDAVAQAFAAGPLEQVVEVWLMPALEMLGTQWRAGRVDVAGEHVVSATIHRRLAVELEATTANTGGPRVVVGLPRGAHHELGILTFTVMLRRAGLDVLYLGADLPAQHWVRVVQQQRPEAVVIGTPTAADVLATRETVAALRAQDPTLRVHVGGGAQFEVGQGTATLGHSVAAAANELAQALHRLAG